VGSVLLAVVASGCGTAGETSEAARARPARASGYITVATAEPIAPVLRKEARAFEAANRLATVSIESAPSSALSTQLLAGRVADLYVAEGTADMDRLVAAALIDGDPLRLARGPSTTSPPRVFSVALMNGTGDQTTSRAFMEFLATPQARSIFAAARFRPVSWHGPAPGLTTSGQAPARSRRNDSIPAQT